MNGPLHLGLKIGIKDDPYLKTFLQITMIVLENELTLLWTNKSANSRRLYGWFTGVLDKIDYLDENLDNSSFISIL